jgi:hypothetical protein
MALVHNVFRKRITIQGFLPQFCITDIIWSEIALVIVSFPKDVLKKV